MVEVFWVKIVRWESYRWQFSGWEFSCYQILKLYKNKIKLATLENKKGNICLNDKKVTCLKHNKVSTCKWQKYIISVFFNLSPISIIFRWNRFQYSQHSIYL